MRLPIQHAFSWPDRWDGALPTLSLLDCRRLEFEAPDHDRFPACAWLPGPRGRRRSPGGAERGQRGRRGVFLEGAVPFPAIAGASTPPSRPPRQGVQRPGTLAAIRNSMPGPARILSPDCRRRAPLSRFFSARTTTCPTSCPSSSCSASSCSCSCIPAGAVARCPRPRLRSGSAPSCSSSRAGTPSTASRSSRSAAT